MAFTDSQRRARAKYREKVEKLQFELYPTDEDIKRRIAERVEAGEKKAAYIKRLIREDIEKQKDIEKHKPIIDRALYERAQEKIRTKKKDNSSQLPNDYQPPLGYKMQDGQMVINEEEAEAVKRAMDEYINKGSISSATNRELERLWRKRFKR